MLAKWPAPCAARMAQPSEGASATSGTSTGRRAVSAWICSHSGERVAPPPAVISVIGKPAWPMRSRMARVPKPMPSITARNTCAGVCARVRPVMAPRDSGSVCGVRLPWKWSCTSTPSAPGGSAAASAFRASRSSRPVKRRSQATMEPVEVWPPSITMRPG